LESKLDILTGGAPRWGNNIVDPGEVCDDGNNINGDGCSATCFPELCGNDIVDVGEQCDDGNLITGDSCNEFCQVETCIEDSDCQQGQVCTDDLICEGPSQTVVVFRTNVLQGDYSGCSRDDNCWIVVDFNQNGSLDAFGFAGRSSRCDPGTPIIQTPRGFDVNEYGYTNRLKICDEDRKQTRWDSRILPQDIEFSRDPTAPFTGNQQETIIVV